MHSYLPFLLLVTCAVPNLCQMSLPQVFHGTSVLVYPNASSAWPGNATFKSANFYCYFTGSGYISFGWWLPAVPGANYSHCDPGSSRFDWYEVTTTFTCNETGCRAHILNYNASSELAFEDDYALSALDLGNGNLGQLGLSYFDKEGGGYAIGTRRVLSERASGRREVHECLKAIRTLQKLQTEQGLRLPFKLEDICPQDDMNGTETTVSSVKQVKFEV